MTTSVLIRRLLLGVVVGASFGLVIGALVASWVLGRAAGSTELVRGIGISLAAVGVGAVAGGVLAWRSTRGGGDPPR